MNEKKIWDTLVWKTGNPYGTAAIMGTLMAESSLNPECATGKKKTANYAMKADNGEIDFENDGVAFGLVQWCFSTRKKGLLDLAKIRGVSVGNLDLQLEYMWTEMQQSYKSVWSAVTGGTNIRSISDTVMLKYEKPAGTSEAAKQKRANYAKQFYNQFAEAPQPEPSEKKMVIATSQVNLRSGPGKSNDRIGELKKGQRLEWIETQNGWHKAVVWVSGEFSKVEG